MGCSSRLGIKIFVCTRARTISFPKSHRFSKSVESTMSYKRGTENVILKTRFFDEKTRVSRGGNVGFQWGRSKDKDKERRLYTQNGRFRVAVTFFSKWNFDMRSSARFFDMAKISVNGV